MRYTLLLEPDEGGTFAVSVPSLPGIATFGATFEQAVARGKEAIQAHVAGLRISGDDVPVEDAAPLLVTVEVDEVDPAEAAAAARAADAADDLAASRT